MEVITVISIIAGTVGTLVSIFLGIAVYAEKKKYKKEIKRQEELVAKEEECTNRIAERIRPDFEKSVCSALLGYASKKEVAEAQDKLIEAMEKIQQGINQTNAKLDDSVKFGLKGEIIQFSEDLKSGSIKTDLAYEHIHNAYEQYKKLGGNGFIEEAFNNIVEKQKENQNKK